MQGSGRNPLFVTRYDGFDGKWTFRLRKHLETKILQLIPVQVEKFIGANILHRLQVDDSE